MNENVDFVVGISQERNQILTPDRPFLFDEAVFETAYVDIRNLFVQAIGISNPRTDRYLPRVHDRYKPLVDWNERAIGTYYTGTNLKNTSVEAYYFYKKETGDLRPMTHAQYQGDRHISTAGGRVVEKFRNGWRLTGETALQWCA